jgi:glycosyltransferase involved in cell wall biosynthesis
VLLWNAILRNEAARIERCVKSLLPHVDGAVIVDTGSTDGTPEIIRDLFGKSGKPLEIHHAEFKNFSQARNEALARARASRLPFDYLLLSDADMELVVEDPNWKRQLNGGPAYDVRQEAGTLSYWNRRLLHRSAQGIYLCTTHEFLDVPAAGNLDGIWFQDYADGSNRPGKFEKDIALLEEGLKTETSPGLVQRMEFYLAQSLFDKGDWAKAAEHYKKRVELDGWDEERWNAQLHYAHCLGNLGDNPRFVWEMLQAYAMRPSRAETLYDLAKWFRERGQNHVSLLFSETGLGIPASADHLFVNRYVYDIGHREEFAICAFYDPTRRERGARISDELALERKGTWQSREQARSNLYWYLKPLAELVPSFKPMRLGFPEHRGYVPCNPSVINHNGQPLILVRTVNYVITEEGRYAIRSADGTACGADYPIDTRNYLLSLDGNGNATRVSELTCPSNLPAPRFELVRGFEDSRLFEWNRELWTLSTVRELTPQGLCEQVLAPLVPAGQDAGYADTWSRILSPTHQHEKNWMPWVRDGELCFVYRLGTLVNPQGDIIAQHETAVDCGHISGGSQVVEIAKDVNLCIVHEARTKPGVNLRFYWHRFACLAADGRLVALSRPFFFHDRQIEFAAGLAVFGDELMVSYGIRDREAWIGRMAVKDVLRLVV